MKRVALTLILAAILALTACEGAQQAIDPALPTESAQGGDVPANGEIPPGDTVDTADSPPEPGTQVVPSLTTNVWLWADFTTPAGTMSIDDPNLYTIQFGEDGTVNINADCNIVLGTYTTDGLGGITIAPGPSTMAFCGEASLDQAFLSGLSSAAIYFAFENDPDLYIDLAADAGTMRFTPGEAVDTPLADSGLTGITWEWVSLMDPIGQTVASDPSRYTIVFNEDGTTAITADCNNVLGTYFTEGSNITIALGPTTTAFCGEESQDQLFLNSLTSVVIYFVDEGELFMDMLADAGTLTFRSGGAAEVERTQASGLTGISWEWTGTNGPDSEIVSADPSRYTIVFNDDGSATIQADCNDVSAMYTADEAQGSLSMVMGPATLAFCGDDTQDQDFLAGLTNATTYAIADDGGNHMTIGVGSDGTNMTFQRAAAEEASADDSGLVGVTWAWASSSGAGGVVDVAEPDRYTIDFMTDGTAAIKADCNQVVAGYTAGVDGSLSIQLGPATLAACPADTQDSEFLASLSMVSSYNIEGGELYMQFSDGSGVMRMVVLPATPEIAPETTAPETAAGDLVGPVWQWTTLQQIDGITTIADPTRYTITFNADGTAAIRADCNNVTATFEVAFPDVMTITPGASTLAACGPGSMDQIFLGGLSAASGYALDQNGLGIALQNNNGTMTFVVGN